jgi:hypothetical protein
MMPQDISTCWNSTFNMLDFTIQYCMAINTMTTACDFGLHQYELAPIEWKIARQLQDVLKVRMFILLQYVPHVTRQFSDFQRCNAILFLRYSKSCNSNFCHGHYQQHDCHNVGSFTEVLSCDLCCPCCWVYDSQQVLQ